MRAFIFEDAGWEQLTPLTYIKPVFELRCGYYALLDRILRKLPDLEKGLGTRNYLAPLVRKKFPFPVNEEKFFQDDLLLVNGRWLAMPEDALTLKEEGVWMCGNSVVYAVARKETLAKFWQGDFFPFLDCLAKGLRRHDAAVHMIDYPWNLIHHNPHVLRKDFEAAGKKGAEGTISGQAVFHGPADLVYVAPEAEVHPLVVLDTKSGPIYIDRKAKVFPNSRVEGPCYLGEDTQIMSGANIREGNSFGPVCRIGGEVEESIFHSYSNKYHDGFIGHAYVGEFVNLGALTTNSDLKNDYTTVSVYVNGVLTDTGDMKVGSFIGDHTKTSIGVLLNTGTVAGLMCNLTAGGVLPKFFPSFSWYVNGKFSKGFGLEMMLETARAAMGRRKRTLIPEEEQAIRTVYEMTAEKRKDYIRKSRRIS